MPIDHEWVDCPSCGAKGSMERRTDVAYSVTPHGCRRIEIEGLEGYFCRLCEDGVWTRASIRKIGQAVGRARVQQSSGSS